MTPEEIAVSEGLAAAAEYIAERGWIQHDLVNETGAVCAMGAIGRCMSYSAANLAYTRLREYLGLPETMDDSQVTLHSVAYWNDMPGRTAEDVILALKGAAHDH